MDPPPPSAAAPAATTDAGDAPETQLTFKVKATSRERAHHSITMADSATVGDLKAKLSAPEYEDLPVERQRLIFAGKVLKNDDTLAAVKIKNGDTMHLVKSAASNPTGPGSAAAAGAASGGGSAAARAAAAAVPTNMAAGTQAGNILDSLTSARYAGMNMQLPSASAFGPDGVSIFFSTPSPSVFPSRR